MGAAAAAVRCILLGSTCTLANLPTWQTEQNANPKEERAE